MATDPFDKADALTTVALGLFHGGTSFGEAVAKVLRENFPQAEFKVSKDGTAEVLEFNFNGDYDAFVIELDGDEASVSYGWEGESVDPVDEAIKGLILALVLAVEDA